MKLIKKFLWGLVLILLSFGLKSQTVFKSGYVINNQGERVNGFVGDSFWKSSPEVIDFKVTKESDVQRFTILDIREFGFEGLVFESQKVSVNRIFSDDEKFDTTPEVEYSERHIFLENLVDGPKSLYQYKDKSGYTRYYIKQDGQFKLLLFQEYLQIDGSGKVEKIAIKKYTAQLYAYFSDCSNFQSSIKSTNYKRKSLISLFEKYWKCKDVEDRAETVIRKKTIKPLFTILAGVNNTKLNFDDSRSRTLIDTRLPAGLGYQIGGGIEYYFSRRKHASIDIDLLYTNFKTEKEDEVIGTNRVDLIKSSLNYSSIRLQVLVRRYYSLKSKRLFINIGASYGTLSFSKNERIIQRSFSGIVNESTSKILPDPFNSYKGALIGVGLLFNNYSLELRHEIGSNLGGSGVFDKTRSARSYLLFGIKI